MNEFTQNEIERQRKRAAEELTRIICELLALSGKTQMQMAEMMGYSSRRPIWDMCNYRYGQHLYPEWRLSSFLSAVGVRWPQDVNRVFSIYDSVAGRDTTRELPSIHYDPALYRWVRQEEKPSDPETETLTMDHNKQREYQRLIASSS
jgi:hypothetical protein